MRPREGLARVLELAAEAAAPATVLIDGPSGSGKSTFADALCARWPAAQLARLDEFYPGWSGLEEASTSVVRDILEPRAEGAGGRWRRWDWIADAPAEWHRLDAGRPLIVEGCGCLSRRAAPLADVGVWVVAPDEVRRGRALARDGGRFDERWDMWEAQWIGYRRRERPETAASVIIRADGTQPSVAEERKR